MTTQVIIGICVFVLIAIAVTIGIGLVKRVRHRSLENPRLAALQQFHAQGPYHVNTVPLFEQMREDLESSDPLAKQRVEGLLVKVVNDQR